jgi:hypothetical protein
MVWVVSLLTQDLSTLSLTPEITVMVFGVWLSSVSQLTLAHPVLYPHNLLLKARPKSISGRTSYLRVRLAFHL